jgi:hypothetical protein
MKNRTLLRLTISCTALVWALSALHGLAQTRPAGLWGTDERRTVPQALSQAEGTPPASSPAYSFTVLNFPGTLYTNGFGINSGAASSKVEIVGGIGPGTADPIGFFGGFLMYYAASDSSTKETFRGVNISGASQQGAGAVNDSGEIVGYYSDSSAAPQGYLQSGGTFTTIAVPFSGATWTEPGGINNSGEVAGYWLDSTTSHGFLLSGGAYTSFDYPGAVFTVGIGINNHGAIAGFYGDTSGVYHGFSLSGGTYTSIDVDGAIATEAYGINDAGDIVGIYCLTSKCFANFETFQGFVSSGGSIATITIPGATASGPSGINDKGVIAGVYYDAVGRHGFLATPK